MLGHERLSRTIPADIVSLLEQAEEDVEAERVAVSVNGDLHEVCPKALVASPRAWSAMQRAQCKQRAHIAVAALRR